MIIKLLVPSVDIQVIVIVFALLAASYTIPGGLSSAINAEIIQACILIVGSVLLAIYVTVSGGFDYLKELFISGDYMVKLIRPLDDSSTPWLALIIGMPITGLYFWANNQTLVQRVLSAKNLNEGRKGVMLNGGITLTTLFLFAMPGVMCQKLFPDLGSPDMVYPAMILNLMPVGLLGIMIAVLFAALTSALSAIMNSTSTLFTMDFYCKIDKHANDKKLVRVNCLCHRYCHSSIVGSPDRKIRFNPEVLSGNARLSGSPYCSGIYCWDIQPPGQWARGLFRLDEWICDCCFIAIL